MCTIQHNIVHLGEVSDRVVSGCACLGQDWTDRGVVWPDVMVWLCRLSEMVYRMLRSRFWQRRNATALLKAFSCRSSKRSATAPAGLGLLLGPTARVKDAAHTIVFFQAPAQPSHMQTPLSVVPAPAIFAWFTVWFRAQCSLAKLSYNNLKR